MALRSRFAISISAGILAAAAAVTPAVADDGGGTQSDPGASQGGDWGGSGGDWGGGHEQEFTPGRVTASTLLLRSAPNRGSQVIRTAHRGDRVRIFCKTEGQSVQGNRHWYLLADGTWAWGSARYIETRHSPRWC
ncbi:SH3 domain-containing protein [Streptomyces sp. UG1]|uniref:SH3 domain-containing protein n=1 Tax=Streptomyces sp. UG1 TaxID=3417652 RepID=UPI003CF96087